MLQNPIRPILDEYASNSPAPGGGSASAMAGATGAALVSMVCRLTIGKKKYEEVWAEMEATLGHSEQLRDRLIQLIDEDSAAFDQVMAAFKLSKETPEQVVERKNAIEDATKNAAEVPLKTMRACLDVMAHAEIAAAKGNANAASDAGVAAHLLEASAQGARLNVLINLGGLADRAFAEQAQAEADRLMAAVSEGRNRVAETVMRRIS